jgi:hypothetical protein
MSGSSVAEPHIFLEPDPDQEIKALISRRLYTREYGNVSGLKQFILLSKIIHNPDLHKKSGSATL